MTVIKSKVDGLAWFQDTHSFTRLEEQPSESESTLAVSQWVSRDDVAKTVDLFGRYFFAKPKPAGEYEPIRQCMLKEIKDDAAVMETYFVLLLSFGRDDLVEFLTSLSDQMVKRLLTAAHRDGPPGVFSDLLDLYVFAVFTACNKYEKRVETRTTTPGNFWASNSHVRLVNHAFSRTHGRILNLASGLSATTDKLVDQSLADWSTRLKTASAVERLGPTVSSMMSVLAQMPETENWENDLKATIPVYDLFLLYLVRYKRSGRDVHANEAEVASMDRFDRVALANHISKFLSYFSVAGQPSRETNLDGDVEQRLRRIEGLVRPVPVRNSRRMSFYA